jgi:hypothetical protein
MSELPSCMIPKPARGASWVARRETRKQIESAEEAEKRKVRARDGRCRWPHCENCRAYKPRLEVAHVCGAKGMGGDRGVRSSAEQMMLLDFVTHGEQEAHRRDVRPLTAEGTAGPCEFWKNDKPGDPLYLVARELAPFVYERD